MFLCQCDGMGTAGRNLHLFEGSWLCPVLVATDQAAPKAGGLKLLMCCRDAVFPREALTCGICLNAAALK